MLRWGMAIRKSDSAFEMTKSAFAEKFLMLEGSQFSLDDYPFYRDIYDGTHPQLLLMTGRQVAKSTTVGNFMISETCCVPHWKTLFVSPSQEQTARFSQSRVGKVIAYSPMVQKFWMNSESSSRVMFKSFKNGSEQVFSYASDDPDRARGVSADRVVYDEVQDILYTEVIPVINECMANSDYAYEAYAGTPKTVENTIQTLWEWSTQSEWVMKCTGCGKHQFWRDDRCIGKLGPVCVHCGKYVDVRTGHWYNTHKFPEDHRGKQLQGFHVPQFILPNNVPISCGSDAKSQELAQRRWRRIVEKHESYPKAKFMNEVVGVSESEGVRIISQEELESLCQDYVVGESAPADLHMMYDHVVAGIDWSGGGSLGTSHTVLWIWGVLPPRGDYEDMRLSTLYFKIYDEGNPISTGIMHHIIEQCVRYKVNLIYADAGVGALPNSMLREAFGSDRAQQVAFRGGAGAAQTFGWNGRDRYMADKTTAIDSFMLYLKRKAVIYPNKKQMVTTFAHILAEYEEETRAGNKVWRHAPLQPDDALMAQVFGFLAAKTVIGRSGQIGYAGVKQA